MQGKKEYQEKLFANFQLSERVPGHNFYRSGLPSKFGTILF